MSIFDFLKRKKNNFIEEDILKENTPFEKNNEILNTEKNFDMNKFSAFNKENEPTIPGPEYSQNPEYQNLQNNLQNNFRNNIQQNNINQEIIILKKDIELLNEKMNSLKTILESINQRLQNIEQQKEQENLQYRQYRQYR